MAKRSIPAHRAPDFEERDAFALRCKSPIASFRGGGVQALDKARDFAIAHLLLGEDGEDIIEAVVEHSSGCTRYAIRADAWEAQHKRLTAQSSKQNGLVSPTPHFPSINITPRTRFK